MHRKHLRFHIGLRTAKTAAAAVVAMCIAQGCGATESKLVFAMLGAMDAVQPTRKASVRACLIQIVGIGFGAAVGLLLLQLPLHPIAAAGLGILLTIALYNASGLHLSPVLPCLILVTLCTAQDIQPVAYALGRVWDSTIGLSVGLVINILVFPYDRGNKA